ncbi:ferritin-like metal-binding protein YciE [Paraburkholderia sp. MM5477-R1]
MTAGTVKDLLIHSLSYVYSAEMQSTKALPKLARAATSPELKALFEQHLEETHGQAPVAARKLRLATRASIASR